MKTNDRNCFVWWGFWNENFNLFFFACLATKEKLVPSKTNDKNVPIPFTHCFQCGKHGSYKVILILGNYRFLFFLKKIVFCFSLVG